MSRLTCGLRNTVLAASVVIVLVLDFGTLNPFEPQPKLFHNDTFLNSHNETRGVQGTEFQDDPCRTKVEAELLGGPFFYRPEPKDPRPRNLRLVLVGDSVTRYHYIALAYFLQTGEWLTEAIHPSPLFHHQYGNGWNGFFRGSNAQLQPNENCDCFMAPGRFYFGNYCENRYFSDPDRGNYVAYINKFGFKPAHGHWRPEEAFSDASKLDVVNSTEQLPYLWDYEHWNDTILEHIAKLVPKPDFLILNAGLHPNDLPRPDVHHGIVDVAAAAGIIPIYKTTTYPNSTMRGGIFRRAAHDKLLCGGVFEHCLDMTWTSDLEGVDSYYDENHFKPDVNTRMNLQMLNFLNALSNSSDTINTVGTNASTCR